MPKAFSLDQLENRLQALIEVRLVRLLPGSRSEDVVVHQLAAAVRSSLDADSGDGSSHGSYQVRVPPEALEQWQGNVELMGELTEVIKTIARESGEELPAPPNIQVISDASLSAGDIRIDALTGGNSLAETRGTPNDVVRSAEDEVAPINAFLIVGGVRVFPLDRSVINIGRRADNHLVLDDPRVSRYHAQVRSIRGRYVLFDLNSTGGTFVNGKRTSQSVLYPGDVISLAGLSIIFGQDNPPSVLGGHGTEPLKPAPVSDRPTVALRRPPEENTPS